jgi:hypothetical protein
MKLIKISINEYVNADFIKTIFIRRDNYEKQAQIVAYMNNSDGETLDYYVLLTEYFDNFGNKGILAIFNRLRKDMDKLAKWLVTEKIGIFDMKPLQMTADELNELYDMDEPEEN